VQPASLTPVDIARAMRISESFLNAIIADTAPWYKPRRTRVIKGKPRQIDAPKPVLKALLRKLHRFLAAKFSAHRNVHGGAKRRSCFTSARVHMGRQYIIKRDVSECYPSVTTNNLFRQLEAYGFRVDTARTLSFLMTLSGRLPQGSPVSADALNFYLQDLDENIAAACARLGCRYSRTYDDIIVSTDFRQAIRPIGMVIESQIKAHGLEVNARKRKKEGFLPPDRPQRVHNIDVKSSRGVRIVKEHARAALDVATAYVLGARCVSPASIEGLARLRSRVAGYMHYCRQADFGPARHIRLLLEQGDRKVREHLRREGVTRGGKWWVKSGTRNEPRRLARLWQSLLEVAGKP